MKIFKQTKGASVSKLMLILATTLSLMTGSVFANGDSFGIQGGGEDTNIALEEGQLVVSLGGGNDFSIQSTEAKVDSQVEALEAAGLTVVDSLIDTSTQKNDSIGVMSLNDKFKAEIINKMGYVYLVEYNAQDYSSVDNALESVKTDLEAKGLSVRYVEPNYTMYALDMHPNQEWHYNMIKAPDAWTVTPGSSTVKVAVLDTGCDNTHPNLKNFVDMNLAKSFVGGDTMDRQSHGTHVSGTIASYGDVSGVMQTASIIPVKVLGDDGTGSTYGIQQGILYAASIKADVINMSLGGGGYSQGMDEACQTAVNSGTVVVAASGNSGTGSISYPAKYSSVIAVGAVDQNRTRAYFSQYGTGLEVMAPGVGIYSTVPGGKYDSYDGTSMATPHVAGVVGLIRSANKNLTAVEVREILKTTAVNAGPANEYGYGIVDAYAAVKAAQGEGPGPSEDVTITTIKTNKEVYARRDAVAMTAKVVDADGVALAGAKVLFTITKPNGYTYTYSRTTNSNGYATYTMYTYSNSTLGTYEVKVDTTLSGYTGSTASKTFKLTRYGY